MSKLCVLSLGGSICCLGLGIMRSSLHGLNFRESSRLLNIIEKDWRACKPSRHESHSGCTAPALGSPSATAPHFTCQRLAPAAVPWRGGPAVPSQLLQYLAQVQLVLARGLVGLVVRLAAARRLPAGAALAPLQRLARCASSSKGGRAPQSCHQKDHRQEGVGHGMPRRPPLAACNPCPAQPQRRHHLPCCQPAHKGAPHLSCSAGSAQRLGGTGSEAPQSPDCAAPPALGPRGRRR